MSWEKDGTLVLESDDIQIETVAGTSRLTISNADPSDAGVYQCVGVNRVGRDGDSTTLSVIGMYCHIDCLGRNNCCVC